MKDWYWNTEDDTKIICPYCGHTYEPSYEETYIGNVCVDCYEEDTQTVTCDECGKKFTVTPHMADWEYETETIDGEMTEEEHETRW